jgi:hypothetical protein
MAKPKRWPVAQDTVAQAAAFLTQHDADVARLRNMTGGPLDFDARQELDDDDPAIELAEAIAKHTDKALDTKWWNSLGQYQVVTIDGEFIGCKTLAHLRGPDATEDYPQVNVDDGVFEVDADTILDTALVSEPTDDDYTTVQILRSIVKTGGWPWISKEQVRAIQATIRDCEDLAVYLKELLARSTKEAK